MKTVKTWDKKTATEIIKSKNGVTNGDDNMSGDIIWYYATNTNPDGTIDNRGPCACGKDNADCIVITSVRRPLAQMSI